MSYPLDLVGTWESSDNLTDWFDFAPAVGVRQRDGNTMRDAWAMPPSNPPHRYVRVRDIMELCR